MRTLFLLLFAGTLALASAAESYKLNLFYPSQVGGNELRAGSCVVTVSDGQVVIKQGRKKVEANVKVETADEEFKSTTVRYATGDETRQITEIRLGGTNTRLVFN